MSNGALSELVDAAAARLQSYPHLARAFTRRRLQGLASDWFVAWWHPILAVGSPEVRLLLDRLEAAISTLELGGVSDVAERVKHLHEANTIENFNAARDELLYAAKLSPLFPVRFVRTKGPDLAVTLGDGSVNVEFTAVHVVSLDRLKAAIGHALSDADPDGHYMARVTYDTQAVVVPDSLMRKFVTAVRDHVHEHPGPDKSRLNRRVAYDPHTRIQVAMVPCAEGGGYVASSSHGGFVPGPAFYFDRVMERVKTKALGQLPRDERNVVLVDLVRDEAPSALYFGDDRRWEIFAGEINVSQIPDSVDAIVLLWVDALGSGWGQPRVIRNPASEWARGEEAGRLLNALAEPLSPPIPRGIRGEPAMNKRR